MCEYTENLILLTNLGFEFVEPVPAPVMIDSNYRPVWRFRNTNNNELVSIPVRLIWHLIPLVKYINKI
jgi:hypothetical protein